MFNQELATQLAITAATPGYQEYKARRLRQLQWVQETFPTIYGTDSNRLADLIADLQICRHCNKQACMKDTAKFTVVAQLEYTKNDLYFRYGDCRNHPPLTREQIVEQYQTVYNESNWLITAR